MSQGDLRAEMRLVETGEGWATAIEPDASAVHRFSYGLSAVFIAVVGASLWLGPMVLLAMGLTFPAILTLVYVRWTHVRLRAHGIEVGALHTRAVPTPEQVREGRDAGGLLVPDRKPARMLPFSEMTDLGFTDCSVWFAMGAERTEISLPSVSRADIERLHDAIREPWARYRAGLQGTEAEADARRRQLAALHETR
ncbi:MAG: hypothetical protein H6737_03625 [Alphaproteobacteria bacterium]|nr:hypothetical protein [Alphaproteobacteria bacterium]